MNLSVRSGNDWSSDTSAKAGSVRWMVRSFGLKPNEAVPDLSAKLRRQSVSCCSRFCSGDLYR